MEAIVLTNRDLEIEDVEYLRHGDNPLLLRLFKPAGSGPFPLHRPASRRRLVSRRPH